MYRNPPTPDQKPTQQIAADDLQQDDEFGASVSISGNWLVIGAPGGDKRIRDSGVVYLYKLETTWVFKDKLDGANAVRGDRFGTSVSLSGDTLVVGAPGDSDRGSRAGSVYIFERLGENAWSQTAEIHADDARPFDAFGSSVAIGQDTSTLVVGAPFADNLEVLRNFGAAYVFKRAGGASQGWVQEEMGKLTAGAFRPDNINIQFGAAVAIEGDRIVVGAPGDDGRGRDSGAAYVFERKVIEPGWSSFQLPVDGPDPGRGEQFGTAVLIDGESVIIGARFDDQGGAEAGAAYIFKREGSWRQTLKLFRPNQTKGAFGHSLAALPDQVFLGGYVDDVVSEPSGAVTIDAGSVAVCSKKVPPGGCLSIIKTDHQSTVCPKESVTYEITVSNGKGLGTVTGATVIDDFSGIKQLEGVKWKCRPRGGASCTRSGGPNLRDAVTLPENSQVLYTVTATVAAGAKDPIINRARVEPPTGITGPNCETDHKHETEDTTVIQTSGNLAVSVMGPPSSVPQGEEAPYTVEVIHSGAPMTGMLEVTVSGGTVVTPLPTGCGLVPGGFTCSPDRFAVGSASLPRSFKVLQTPGCPCPSGPINVEAAVTATTLECDEDDNTETVMTTVTCSAALDLTAFEVIPSPCGEVHYQADFTNRGPSAACATKLVQSIPVGLAFIGSSDSCVVDGANVRCPFGDLAKDQMETLVTRFAVPAACVNSIDSTATVSSTTPDPDTGNNSRFVSTSTSCPAKLRIKKTDVPDPVVPGQELGYDITVENFGASAASDVVVRDDHPPELTGVRWCEGTNCVPKLPPPLKKTIDLAAGEAKIFRLSGNVPPMCSDELLNVARITPPENLCDDPADNVYMEMTQVSGDGVRVYCVEIDGPMLELTAVTYTFLLLNCGPANQADNPGDEFTDTLPAGLTLISAGADSGIASTLGNTATWNGAVPVGGMVVITVTAMINAGTAGTTICNQAMIAFDADGDGINESMGLSDDPGEPGDADPCCFRVLFDFEIPALSAAGLAVLILLLAGLAMSRLRRRSP